MDYLPHSHSPPTPQGNKNGTGPILTVWATISNLASPAAENGGYFPILSISDLSRFLPCPVFSPSAAGAEATVDERFLYDHTFRGNRFVIYRVTRK